MPNLGEPDSGWTDTFAWTRYRGPQPYPCPGAWVLGLVEGDGIGWKRFPGLGEPLEYDGDVLDEHGTDVCNDEMAERASLINEIETFDRRDPDAEEIRHTLKIDGEEVFSVVNPDDEELFASVAEALSRFDAGERIDAFAAEIKPTTGTVADGEQSKRELERKREQNNSLEDFG